MKLKPCPFCGCKKTQTHKFIGYIISCAECKASVSGNTLKVTRSMWDIRAHYTNEPHKVKIVCCRKEQVQK